jgi:transcription elongation GreA/GreB family factor
MQQDSKRGGKPLVGKSRAELIQSIQAHKTEAERNEKLAREARDQQRAIERALSDLDKMEDGGNHD